MVAAVSWADIWPPVLGTILAALAVAVGTAMVRWVRDRGGFVRANAQDVETLSDFFFDTEKDPRTGRPARQGWTTKIEGQLLAHTGQLRNLDEKVDKILAEVTEDSNGGENLRGEVKRGADAAEAAKDAVESDG